MSKSTSKVGPAYWAYKITFCETLVAGWDSYNAEPPTPEVIAAAREFLTVVLAKDAPISRLNPSVVGGIGFTFRVAVDPDATKRDAPSAYVEFRNTGTCHALYADPTKDAMAAPVEKVEMTPEGYEKLLTDVALFLNSRE